MKLFRNDISTAGGLRAWTLAAGAFLVSAQFLYAARFPVDYYVDVGFGGVIADQSSLFPVAVTIDNKVAGTTGIIELSQPNVSGNSEAKEVLSFSSPAPSTKRFVLLTRIERKRDLHLKIVFKEHIKTIRKTLKAQRSDKPLILCLGMPRSYRFSEATRKYKFVNISKQSLPSDPVALDGIHAVMFSGPAFASLSREQVSALRQWAVTGGILVFVDNPANEVFRGNFRGLTEKSGLNAGFRGAMRFGAGIIVSSGTDAQPGAAFWEGDKKLTEILFPALAEEKDEGHSSTTGYFSDLWRTKRSYGIGGFVSIIIIIAAYICVIGPLDRWIVKRIKKPFLTWILFPVAIAVFSLVAYWYSSMVNVGAMRAAYVNILDTAGDCGVARGNSLFWVYSAKNATYEMDTSLENVHFSVRESLLGAGHVAGVELINGRNSIISARIPIFSSKEFDAAWYMPWTHKIACTREGTRLKIVIPEELEVNHAFLADEDGLTKLTKKDEAWIGADECTPWEDTIAGIAGSLGSPWHYGRRSLLGSDETLMPNEQTLRNYLICMSFPWKITKDQLGGSHQAVFYRQERDSREKLMDIRNRLRVGKLLLLFLDSSCNLLPVRIRRHFPKTVHMNLVRMQIAEDV